MRLPSTPVLLALLLAPLAAGAESLLLAARGPVRGGASATGAPLAVGSRLAPGGRLLTAADGAAEVLLADRAVLRLGPDAAVALHGEREIRTVALDRGRIRIAAVGALNLTAGGLEATTAGGVLLAEAAAAGERVCVLSGAATAGPRGAPAVALGAGECLGPGGARRPVGNAAAFPAAGPLAAAPPLGVPLDRPADDDLRWLRKSGGDAGPDDEGREVEGASMCLDTGGAGAGEIGELEPEPEIEPAEVRVRVDVVLEERDTEGEAN